MPIPARNMEMPGWMSAEEPLEMSQPPIMQKAIPPAAGSWLIFMMVFRRGAAVTAPGICSTVPPQPKRLVRKLNLR